MQAWGWRAFLVLLIAGPTMSFTLRVPASLSAGALSAVVVSFCRRRPPPEVALRQGRQAAVFVHARNKKRSLLKAKDSFALLDGAADTQVALRAFREYYREQRICPGGDAEVEELVRATISPPPLDFRLNPHSQLFTAVQEHLRAFQEALPAGQLTQIPWHPKGLAWRFDSAAWTGSVPEGGRGGFAKDEDDGGFIAEQSPVDRWTVATSDSLLTGAEGTQATGTTESVPVTGQSAAERLRRFLQEQQDRGALARHELVSMLPALILAPEPQDNVLDLCAAPGSKTTQLLGILPSTRDGILLANDPDRLRLARLRHRMQKEADARATVLTSFDARFFPFFRGTPFHRILADVPCSGDGMLRRLPRTLSTWTAGEGCRLHITQGEILARAVALLPPGGRVVYSTCSLNPVEDEAVVAHVLAAAPHHVTLEALPSIPGVCFARGLKTWLVPRAAADPSLGGFFTTIDEVPQAALASGRVTASMFPPPPGSVAAEALERCARALPHANNAGGFFIALLSRAPDAKEGQKAHCHRKAAESEDFEAAHGVTAPSRAARLRVVESDVGIWTETANFFGLENSAIRGNASDASNRNDGGLLAAGDLLWAPSSSGRRDKPSGPVPRHLPGEGKTADCLCDRLDVSGLLRGERFLDTRLRYYGATAFWPLMSQRHGGPKQKRNGATGVGGVWQVCQEGAKLLAPECSRRNVRFGRKRMRELLARQSVDWSEVEQWGILGEVSGLGSCRTRQGNKLEFGGVLIELDSDKSGIGLELDMVIVCTLEEDELLSVSMRAQEVKGILSLLE